MATTSDSFIDFKALSKRIVEVKEELAQLLHLESFVAKGSTKKRGRPAKIKGGDAVNICIFRAVHAPISSSRTHDFAERPEQL